MINLSVALVLVCFGSVWVYLRFAKTCGLIDVPNSRSSHHEPSLRGGGVIFLPLVFVAWFGGSGPMSTWFYLGILLAAITGLADDLRGLSAGVRALGYMMALAIAGASLGFSWHLMPFWVWFLWLIAGTGVINAWNFMDGINGITVLYTGIVTCSLWYAFDIAGIIEYTPFFMALIAGLCGAAWMNVRPRAIAFLGDVGSVFLGMVIVLLLSILITTTREFGYLLLVLLYGLDTVITIAQRLLRRENIFQAHRTHLYQYLANEHRWPHLRVSILYASIQALINVSVFWYILQIDEIGNRTTVMVIAITGVFYIFIKRWVKRGI